VLDPNLQEEVRVTVVATGLNRQQALRSVASGRDAAAERPVGVRLVTGNSATAPEAAPRATPRPTFARMGAASAAALAVPVEAAGEPVTARDDDYLNIPAFLRRQAD
jgi:cell division protein FtsZ